MQALYQAQISGHDTQELLRQFPERPEYAGADIQYFEMLLHEVESSKDELDQLIAEFGDIPVAQIDPVEHAVLWLALAELQRHPEVPRRVVINEAIELTKAFGAEGGHRYINGLLDRAAGQLRAPGT